MNKNNILDKISLIRQSYVIIDSAKPEVESIIEQNKAEKKKYYQKEKWTHGIHFVFACAGITILVIPLAQMVNFYFNFPYQWLSPFFGVLIAFCIRHYVQKKILPSYEAAYKTAETQNNERLRQIIDKVIKARIISNACKVDFKEDDDYATYEDKLNSIVALDFMYGAITKNDAESLSEAAEHFKCVMKSLRTPKSQEEKTMFAEALASEVSGKTRISFIKQCENINRDLFNESI